MVGVRPEYSALTPKHRKQDWNLIKDYKVTICITFFSCLCVPSERAMVMKVLKNPACFPVMDMT